MKRDMELIRKILLAIEEDGQGLGILDLEFDDYDDEFVSYQIKLLAEAGLITANDCSTRAGLSWRARSLTWDGHEFLDAARNDSVWNKAIAKLKGQASTVPFEVLRLVVIQTCKEMFGLA